MIYIDILYGSRIATAFALMNFASAQSAGIWLYEKATTINSELTMMIGNVAIIPSRIARKCL